MNTSAIIGKKVVAVHQERTTNNANHSVWDVKSITFDDGSKLILSVDELPDDYAVCGIVYKNGSKL